MNVKKLAIAAVALTATLGAGLAEARGRDDVQWSVTIGAPAPVFVAPPVRVFQPVRIHDRGHHYGHSNARGWRDADRDGIPNRFDRVYNPRWDRDGDGVPNRYDRHDNTRHHGWRDRGHDGRYGR
jgi:hypothetical protein